eukprot:scaffold2149_cov406-Prasinococcus_capsulatus_cf.AAC.2
MGSGAAASEGLGLPSPLSLRRLRLRAARPGFAEALGPVNKRARLQRPRRSAKRWNEAQRL